jgi:hypothetical protein
MSLNAPLAPSGSSGGVAAQRTGIPVRAWYAWGPTAAECSPGLGSKLRVDKCELRRDRLQLRGVRGRRRPDLKFMIRAS